MAGCEDRRRGEGTQTKECRWHLEAEKGEETDSPPEPPEKEGCELDFQPSESPEEICLESDESL